MITDYLIGSDPEFFLLDNDKPLPSVSLIGGNKYQPLDIGKGCAVLEDNVMVEFNTPPTDSKDQMIESIHHVFSHVKDKVGEKYPDVKFSNKSVMEFEQEQLNSRQAREFGCSPDLDVYEDKLKTPPDPAMNVRYAGGHIHVGFDTDNFLDDAYKLIKYLDFTFGVPMVVIDKESSPRRKLYGQAGTFRIKPYGIEYRSPSNFWIFKEDNVKFMFEAVNKAIVLFNDEYEIKENVRSIINDNKVEEAKKLCEQYSLL